MRRTFLRIAMLATVTLPMLGRRAMAADPVEETTCIAWRGIICPPSEVAALRMKGFDDEGACTTMLLSIDGPGVRHGPECCYPVTVEEVGCSDPGCDHNDVSCDG